MTPIRIQYGSIVETTVPAIGFVVPGRARSRVVSLLSERLTTTFDWIHGVDLIPDPGAPAALEVRIPGAALGLTGPWVAVCSQVRLVPRSRLKPGAIAVVPEPYLGEIREAVRTLLDL